MTRRTFLAVAAAAPLLSADGEDAARKSGEKWLALLDQAKYKDAWKQASQHQRPQISADEWESQIRAMRTAAGALQQRGYQSAKPSKTLAGAPDGDYLILEYATTFANKPKAVEVVVMSKEPGGWKAAGYSIH
ncbi:MAG: DUF4019 domain-containing protein [Acidobacteria bacterium]|nr:DUF4019 domain-containing protein [Acidobacteriota bacterium]